MGSYIKDGVANNVLCYVSTGRHSLSRDKIALNCLAFYSEGEIKGPILNPRKMVENGNVFEKHSPTGENIPNSARLLK